MILSRNDKLNSLTSNGVYKVPCSCGVAYIGETDR